MPVVLAVAATTMAAVALALAAVAVRRTHRRVDGSDLPGDVAGLRREVAALRAEAADGLRHLAVVRYDAFGDMGGHLSWSLALLDDRGDGVVVSSIHGRSDARTYAKGVKAGESDHSLSPEELQAIGYAGRAAEQTSRQKDPAQATGKHQRRRLSRR